MKDISFKLFIIGPNVSAKKLTFSSGGSGGKYKHFKFIHPLLLFNSSFKSSQPKTICSFAIRRVFLGHHKYRVDTSENCTYSQNPPLHYTLVYTYTYCRIYKKKYFPNITTLGKIMISRICMSRLASSICMFNFCVCCASWFNPVKSGLLGLAWTPLPP